MNYLLMDVPEGISALCELIGRLARDPKSADFRNAALKTAADLATGEVTSAAFLAAAKDGTVTAFFIADSAEEMAQLRKAAGPADMDPNSTAEIITFPGNRPPG